MTNDKTIGKNVRIEYFDQNDNFKNVLPRKGVIIQKLSSKDGAKNWFLLKLDEPFDYQIKIGEPFQFKSLHCEMILIRSRWEGSDIGEPKETSVFILLIPNVALLENEPIDVNNFYHVAWGMCYSLSS